MNQVLVVDDEMAMRAALEANFRRQGWKVTTASGTSEALARFRQAPCPLVVTDMRMPDGDGLSVMQGVRAIAPETAVIFLTAFANVPEAVNAMREGACDFLIKPVSFDQLKESAARVMSSRVSASPAANNGDFIGSSPITLRFLERARQAARTDADILVEAESGTGKELLARLVHRSSPRSQRPFVAVNCAGFPDTLLESELFGHMRGAFTGAMASKAGKFELAHTGTLLLDEIGEMPLSLQPKLLRVLQEREIDRLGDTKPLHVDVRVIATTNRPLATMVAEGKFRADLFFRLNVIPLTLPALRERREDVPDLVKHFVHKYAQASRSNVVGFSPELLERLEMYDWPGNVRELENFVRRALALSPGPLAGLELLPEASFQTDEASLGAIEPGLTLRELERTLLERTLDATGGNRTRTAGMLGVSLRTVRNKIREFGLPPPEGRMNWIESPTMERVEHYLDLVTRRHELISSNLANVDTPGYHTQDINFESEIRRADQHLEGSPASPHVEEVQGLIERPDGNNVSLERETMNLAQVQLQYHAGVELLRNEIRMVQTAINEGK